MKLVVGVTGNFGFGKSAVCRIFARLGAVSLNADRMAHEVFQKGNKIYPRVLALFPEISGKPNRKRIAEIVFKDSKRRERLETLVHPYVFCRIQEEVALAPKPVVIVEAPLLFESGFDQDCDRTVVVTAKPEEVLRRLARSGFKKSEVEARWRAQWPIQKKAARADFVINNSKNRSETQRQTERIWRGLKKLVPCGPVVRRTKG